MSRSLRGVAFWIAGNAAVPEKWKLRILGHRGAWMLVVAGLLGGLCTANAQVDQPADVDVRATLTGDWGGLRSDLERRGIAFNLVYSTEVFANVHGGIRRGAVGNGLFQAALPVEEERELVLRFGQYEVRRLAARALNGV